MSFANPLALALLGLIPLIVILHSISLRWRTQEVSSLVFWREVLRRKRTSIRIRRILANLSLVAEILAAAALAIALAQPRLAGRGASSAGDVILVMDSTASMKSREGATTRFEEARAAALEVLDGLRRGGRMAVIAAAREPRVAAPFTDDRTALSRAIRDLQPTDEPGDLRDSLLLAFSLRDAGRQDRVVVLSDAAFDSLGDLDLSADWIDFRPVGASRSNVGITALQFRKTSASDEYEVFVGLANFSPEPARFPLTIEAGRASVFREEISLEPGQALPVSLAWEGPTEGRVTAEIGVTDDLPTDNRAYAVFTAARPVRVLIVGPESFFLQSMLTAMPNVSVRRVGSFLAPADASESEEPDIVIFEGASEVPPLESGNYILFGAVPPNLGLGVSGTLSGPSLTGWNESHPLLKSVSLEGLVIAQALRLEIAGDLFTSLALSQSSPLMLACSQADLKALMFAFDLEASDLALRPAFPILMANAFSWFFPSWLSIQADQVQAGTPRPLPSLVEEAATVVRPSGKRDTFQSLSTLPGIQETPEVGFYTIEHGERSTDFAVNLSSAGESNIAPRFEVTAGGTQESGAQAEEAASAMQKPIWKAIAIAAAALLVAEWLLWLREKR